MIFLNFLAYFAYVLGYSKTIEFLQKFRSCHSYSSALLTPVAVFLYLFIASQKFRLSSSSVLSGHRPVEMLQLLMTRVILPDHLVVPTSLLTMVFVWRKATEPWDPVHYWSSYDIDSFIFYFFIYFSNSWSVNSLGIALWFSLELLGIDFGGVRGWFSKIFG